MKILLTGQCSLHWGRMEFGNIGNYYIIEPLIRELHSTFPKCVIKTTFQMSARFSLEENIEVLPMDYYYGFKNTDLKNSKTEFQIASKFNEDSQLETTTPYINEVLNADLVINFSGDIWGDNSDFLGEDRFLVGLYKDRTAQLLGKKTVMLAGSPGPFTENKNLSFAKEVFAHYDLVTNREAFSRRILEDNGFNTSKLKDLSCPAFLFEPRNIPSIGEIHKELESGNNKIVGVILCGWNFLDGPFDKWPRENKDYIFLVDQLINFLDRNNEAKLCLMSHSNGFIPGKEPFELIHGRDYPIIKQLQNVLEDKGYSKRIFTLDGVYDAWTTKAIIAKFDMLLSGRVHAAVAGMSQNIPTVVIDYGHEPIAHKLKGFANEAGMVEMVADPRKHNEIFNKMLYCFENKELIKKQLQHNIPKTKLSAKLHFKYLKDLF